MISHVWTFLRISCHVQSYILLNIKRIFFVEKKSSAYTRLGEPIETSLNGQ
jgi:hypothetical protein